MLNQLYDWKRFWCLRTGRFDLSDGGYLSDPESQWGAIHNPDTVPLTSMAMTPCLVLLGEPGIGKSHEMQQHYERTKPKLLKQVTPVYALTCAIFKLTYVSATKSLKILHSEPGEMAHITSIYISTVLMKAY